MDSNKLRYFLVVYETSSIRKAAELLHLSPAALSKSLKQLEIELGFKLITPLGRGIVLTEDGKDFAVRVKPLLDDVDRVTQKIKNKSLLLDSKSDLIKIGSFEVFTTRFLSELLEVFDKGTQFLLREVVPGEMERSLLNHEIDYGITYIPIPTKGVIYEKVSFIQMQIFGNVDFVAKAQSLRFEEIPFVIPTQPVTGSPNKVEGLDGWPDDKISRHVQFRVALMESAIEICRSGLAAAYLPSMVVKKFNQIVEAKYRLTSIPFPKGMSIQKQDVYLVRRKSDEESHHYKKIAKALRVGCKD